MRPDDRTVVEAHLQRLSARDLAAFVADLWDAQGFETERDGLAIVATRGGESFTIRVADAASQPGSVDANVLVTTGGGVDGRAGSLGVVDLGERLWYALDRPAARELCRRHLGGSPSELSPPLWLRVRRWRSGRSVPALAGVLVVAVLTLLAVGVLASSGWVPGAGSSNFQPGGSDTPAATPTGETAWSNESRPVNASTVDPAELPPGVSSEGIEDIDALAAAHSRTIGNQSYSISIERYQPEIWAQEVIDVYRNLYIEVSNGTYRLDAVERANGESIPMGTLYHDGTNTYLAQEGFSGVSYRRVPPTELRQRYPPSPPALTESLVSTRLSTPKTNVSGVLREEGDRLYLLTGSGQPEWQAIGDVRGYNVTARVTETGLVREVSATYTIRDGDRLVEVRREVTYNYVGETTVDPPGWYLEQFGDAEAGT